MKFGNLVKNFYLKIIITIAPSISPSQSIYLHVPYYPTQYLARVSVICRFCVGGMRDSSLVLRFPQTLLPSFSGLSLPTILERGGYFHCHHFIPSHSHSFIPFEINLPPPPFNWNRSLINTINDLLPNPNGLLSVLDHPGLLCSMRLCRSAPSLTISRVLHRASLKCMHFGIHQAWVWPQSKAQFPYLWNGANKAYYLCLAHTRSSLLIALLTSLSSHTYTAAKLIFVNFIVTMLFPFSNTQGLESSKPVTLHTRSPQSVWIVPSHAAATMRIQWD